MARSLIAVLMLVWPFAAGADIYKCTDADGGVVYAQTPCSAGPSVTVSSGTSKVGPADCGHASGFAVWTARLMQGGARSDEVFDRYGGLGALSKGSLGIINYVYSFRSNTDVSAERIGALADAKCRAGSFGDASCEALPVAYTDSIGNCNPEEVPELEATSGPTPAGALPTDQPQLSRRPFETTPSRSDAEVQRCKKSYRDQVDGIDAEMRRGYSSSQGERYRARLRVLTESMRDCER